MIFAIISLMGAAIWIGARLYSGVLIDDEVFAEMYRVSVGCIFVGSAVGGAQAFLRPRALLSSSIFNVTHFVVGGVFLVFYLFVVTNLRSYDLIAFLAFTGILAFAELCANTANIRRNIPEFLVTEICLLVLRLSIFFYLSAPYVSWAAVSLITLTLFLRLSKANSLFAREDYQPSTAQPIDFLSWILILALGWLLPVVMEVALPRGYDADDFFKGFILINAVANVANLSVTRLSLERQSAVPSLSLVLAITSGLALVFMNERAIGFCKNQIFVLEVLGIPNLPLILVIYMSSRILRNATIFLDRLDLGGTRFFSIFNIFQVSGVAAIIISGFFLDISSYYFVFWFLVVSNCSAFFAYSVRTITSNGAR